MEEVVEYKYDSWGNVIGMEGSDYGKWVGSLNPFRYRGYYYDDETGMYYLQSRYYNPEWCRFLNADISLLGNVGNSLHNLYAYAANNPVLYRDPSGMGIFYTPGSLIYTNGREVIVDIDTSTSLPRYSSPNYNERQIQEEIRRINKQAQEDARKKYNKQTVNVIIAGEAMKDNAINVQLDGAGNIRIWDSYKIINRFEMEAVMDVVMEDEKFDPNIYTRTRNSYVNEWMGHSQLYPALDALGLESWAKSAEHVDLESDQSIVWKAFWTVIAIK